MTASRFGERMSGAGIFAEEISRLFEVSARRAGLNRTRIRLATGAFRRAAGFQLELW